MWADRVGRLKREIAILKKCRHPNVVRLREVIDSPASKKIFMGESRVGRKAERG
jgi:serine/threonine protein kinase